MGDMIIINERLAHYTNYSLELRSQYSIKYIVMHYTGNVGDTAKNNCDYYAGPNRKASAHYFVDDDSVWRSVPDLYPAWAVGLGGRNKPYSNVSMYKKITNSNSISIEICGSRNSSEGTEKTKRNAAKLCANLLVKYGLDPSKVYRHYDVTGKICPAWAVNNTDKWNKLLFMVKEEYEKIKIGDDAMSYEQFEKYMEMYLEKRDKMAMGEWAKGSLDYVSEKGLMTVQAPKSFVTREQLATVVERLDKR